MTSDVDCDDTDASVYPGALEVCDGLDNDCNAQIDEGFDVDQDGYSSCGTDTVSADCDDTDAAVYPGTAEICDDGLDNNCDGYQPICAEQQSASTESSDAFLAGGGAGDRAGWSVDSLVDTNGDGFDELIVGAPGDDAAGEQAGVVYVVMGPIVGQYGLTNADAIYHGEAEGDRAGTAATSGDFNGDGVLDLLVGAPNHDEAGTDAGVAYIVFGLLTGSHSLADADVQLLGEEADDRVGYAVASGDLNGDGFDDVVVGAPYADWNGEDAGSVYIVYGPLGSANISLSSADVRVDGQNEGDRAGWSVDSAADHDGDGIVDLLVGMPYSDAGGADSGAVMLVASLDEEAASERSHHPVLSGGGPGERAGWSVDSRAGWSVDSFQVSRRGAAARAGGAAAGEGEPSTVYVGAPGADRGNGPVGSVYVIRAAFSSLASLSDADAILDGLTPDGAFGHSVAAIDDDDGDGYGELLVGAPYHNEGGEDAGAAFLFRGPQYGNVLADAADVTMTGESGETLGFLVASAGDLDGNGLTDMVVSAPADGSEADAGTVYILYGPATGSREVSPETSYGIWVGDSLDQAGTVTLAAGDLTGDGVPDYVVSAPGQSFRSTGDGAIYIVPGPAPESINLSEVDTVLYGNSGEGLGTAVDTGDFNGDGVADLVIGSPAVGGLEDVSSAVYVVLGPIRGMAAVRDVANQFWVSYDQSGRLGTSVANVKDVNGDGFDDILVGDPQGLNDSEVRTGAAYLVYGESPRESAPVAATTIYAVTNWKLTGTDGGSEFGTHLGAAGDVNGDGFHDFLIQGQALTLDGDVLVARGVVTLYHGYDPFDTDWPASIQIFADSTSLYVDGTRFGEGLTGVGDIDGDGVDDFAIGSPIATPPVEGLPSSTLGVDQGAVYLFTDVVRAGTQLFADLDAVALYGRDANDLLGKVIVAGGDINGDGYADLVLGAPDSLGSDGSVYVMYGPVPSVRTTASADLIFVGAGATSFGYSVDAVYRGSDGSPGQNWMMVIGSPALYDQSLPGQATLYALE